MITETPFGIAAAAQNRARTLRYVPSTNLSILDPVFTPAAVTIGHGYCVFDTLYGMDAQMRPTPQMAAGHTVSADGLNWQITPVVLSKAVTDPDPAVAKRAFEAMLTMGKIDVAKIEAARRG